jgi:DNA-binding CsgD family transcriptional regulator
MVYGRREERALIGALCDQAREGRSGVLVLHGEAGVGKSTMLRDAAEQAGDSGDWCLLQGTGVESEVELAFAALHQLLRPLLDRLDRLPAPQASALRGAFGLADTQPNRFLIELATLSLLAEVAKRQPVLCLVDDAQWLDRASAAALAFVARRLKAERIVLLMAARDDDLRQLHAPGLPELHLRGLDPEAAAQLLEQHGGGIAPHVRGRLIEETGGNPLALLEVPATLSGEQLEGREPLPERLPLSTRLRQAFLQRVQRLPQATQALLLVGAAEDSGELATVLAAGQVLELGPETLEPAERAGLVHIAGQQLRFRHPLVRSAVYQSVTFTARQSAHRALAHVLAGEQLADRRAWHLAAAAVGPDEDVATALEDSADRARRRGGAAAAAAALERAAALTLETAPRARRLVAAAEHLWEAGRGQRAQTLLDEAEPIASGATVRAGIAHVRGAIELYAGTPALACTLLVEGAELVLKSNPAQATEMLVLATWGALAAGQLEPILDQIGPAMRRLPGQEDRRIRLVADTLMAFELGPEPRPAAAKDPSRGDGKWPTTAANWPPAAFTWMWPMLVLAEPVRGGVGADQRYARSVAARRAAGTVSGLTVALGNTAMAEVSFGRWGEAIETATEGLRLTRETGQEAAAGYFLALLAGLAVEQGRAEDGQRLAGEALAIAIPRRLAVVAALASWTLALLDLTEGRPAAAIDRLRALSTRGHPTAHAPVALLATGTLLEAAARADALEGMEPAVARFERWAGLDGGAWTLAVARRCRALLTQGPDAERHYRAALAVGGLAEMPLELARSELLYGEWLRRARRRAEARTHLRAALEVFERLGASFWAQRAASELRASGETARRRDPTTARELTPQELRIARLAERGLTNRQIADQLFLSSHTISYHLHNIYTKLGIASRADLRRFRLGGGSPA